MAKKIKEDVELPFEVKREVMEKIISEHPKFVDGLATIYSKFQKSLVKYSEEQGVPFECSVIFSVRE
jgi:hypothetical protein